MRPSPWLVLHVCFSLYLQLSVPPHVYCLTRGSCSLWSSQRLAICSVSDERATEAHAKRLLGSPLSTNLLGAAGFRLWHYILRHRFREPLSLQGLQGREGTYGGM